MTALDQAVEDVAMVLLALAELIGP